VRIAYVTLLSGILALFLLGPRSGAAPTGQAQRVDTRFEIFGFAGLHLVSDRTSVETAPGRYSIAMDLTTRGLASVFVNLETHSEVHGKLIGETVRPEEYTGAARRNGAERSNRVEYGPDGAVLSAVSSPSAGRPALVAADHTRGTVDQLTAYFILERALARGGSCERAIPVFDGRRRYDLRFADAPPEPLPDDAASLFSGPVRVCEVTRQDLDGYTSEDHSEGAYRGKIWYALVNGGELMAPVRMEFDTELGLVKGYLAEVHGGGMNLRLMD
jgi:hypothetical protein